MNKKVIVMTLALLSLAVQAQVSLSELPGKYHLQGQCDIWDQSFASLVTPHDDFTFTMTQGEDGVLYLSSFFYSGMDGSWIPLEYSATAEYHANEKLLYVYPTEWMWDEYMGVFMDPYSHDPMLYFAVEKDSRGDITLTTTPNSVGFYVLTDRGEGNQFYYALDYPGEVRATKLRTYASVNASTLPGEYEMNYSDFDGKPLKTTFSILRTNNGFVLTGMFGDQEQHPLYFEADGRGVYTEIQRKVNAQGRYTYYFGGVVGECRVSFSFDAEGQLVADNYITYTPDWSNWHDALQAVATKVGQSGVLRTTDNGQRTTDSGRSFDLQGRAYVRQPKSGLYIQHGRKVIR